MVIEAELRGGGAGNGTAFGRRESARHDLDGVFPERGARGQLDLGQGGKPAKACQQKRQDFELNLQNVRTLRVLVDDKNNK